MILVDANLLLYVYDKAAPQLRQSRSWREKGNVRPIDRPAADERSRIHRGRMDVLAQCNVPIPASDSGRFSPA